MSSTGTKKNTNATLQRPKASTVFAAAFLAGAAAAVGVNRALDVHIAQNVPQVESESIFVALRSLPKGSPVTIYDVALRDWPVAMLPETALRSDATFDGAVLRHPLREGQPVLSLQIAENTLEQEQQIASVTRTTQRIDQPKRTSAPAFVPYKAAAPIPAILASTQSEVTHHAAKDLNTQTPAPKQSEPDSQQKVEDKTTVADLASVETTPALAQPKDIQQKLPEPLQKEEGERTGDDSVVAEQVVSEKVGQNVGPLDQELPSAPAVLAMESAGVAEKTGNGVEDTGENISTETKERQLASTTDIQPQNSPSIRTTEVSDEKVEVVTSNSNSLSDATPDENADTQEATLEQSIATTPDTIATEQPDMSSEGISSEISTNAEVSTLKEPTLAPPSVEPIDITQSILAEAETRKNSSPDTPQKSSVATLPSKPTPAVAPETSTEGQSATTKARPQTMRYLVVPERIAVQVDQAFTKPQQVARPARPATAASPVQSGNVQPLPKTTAARTKSSQQTVLKSRQAPKTVTTKQAQQLQATAGNAPRSQQRSNQESPSQVASRESITDTPKEPLLRSLFPKISAGLSAVGEEWRGFRDGTATSKETPSSRQAKQNEPRQQRSASRPQQAR